MDIPHSTGSRIQLASHSTGTVGSLKFSQSIKYNLPPITFDTLVTGLDKPGGNQLIAQPDDLSDIDIWISMSIIYFDTQMT